MQPKIIINIVQFICHSKTGADASGSKRIKRCSKLRRHASAHAGSDRRCVRGGWRARKRLGRHASAHAGRLATCMHSRLAGYVVHALQASVVVAHAGVSCNGPTGQRNHGPTVEQRHHPRLPHLSGPTGDTIQRGPTCQS